MSHWSVSEISVESGESRDKAWKFPRDSYRPDLRYSKHRSKTSGTRVWTEALSNSDRKSRRSVPRKDIRRPVGPGEYSGTEKGRSLYRREEGCGYDLRTEFPVTGTENISRDSWDGSTDGGKRRTVRHETGTRGRYGSFRDTPHPSLYIDKSVGAPIPSLDPFPFNWSSETHLLSGSRPQGESGVPGDDPDTSLRSLLRLRSLPVPGSPTPHWISLLHGTLTKTPPRSRTTDDTSPQDTRTLPGSVGSVTRSGL